MYLHPLSNFSPSVKRRKMKNQLSIIRCPIYFLLLHLFINHWVCRTWKLYTFRSSFRFIESGTEESSSLYLNVIKRYTYRSTIAKLTRIIQISRVIIYASPFMRTPLVINAPRLNIWLYELIGKEEK